MLFRNIFLEISFVLNLSHNYGVGELLVQNLSHNYGVGELLVQNLNHNYGVGEFLVQNLSHNNGVGELLVQNLNHNYGVGEFLVQNLIHDLYKDHELPLLLLQNSRTYCLKLYNIPGLVIYLVEYRKSTNIACE